MALARRSLSIALTVFVVVGATWFFGYYEPRDAVRKIPLRVNGAEILVEVADTDEKRGVGLGDRETLGENEGMLFVFEKNSFYTFWMKDMLFPMDIIWINKDKKIVDVITNVQTDTYPDFQYINDFLAQYVLEVNAGFFDKYGLRLGDTMEFSLEEAEIQK